MKFYYKTLAFASLLALAACSDFDEMNTNPYEPPYSPGTSNTDVSPEGIDIDYELPEADIKALKEAEIAMSEDEVPIGCIIVYEGQIIARTHNQKETLKKATGHAEILAINQASEYLDLWHLDGCTMYVTLEPCMMCTGAIIQSRISRLVIGTNVSRWPGFIELIENNPVNHHPDVQQGILKEQCATIVSEFFKRKRRK